MRVAGSTRCPADRLDRGPRGVRRRGDATRSRRIRDSKSAAKRLASSIRRAYDCGHGPLTSDALAQNRAIDGSEGCSFTTASARLSMRIRSTSGGLSGFALRQVARWHRRLSELPVRPKAEYERFLDELLAAQAVESHIPERRAVFRSVSADRRDRAPRARYVALRADEADGSDRSAHGAASLGGGAVAAGESARRQLQSRRISEPSEFRRAEADSAYDSRARECANFCATGRFIATLTSMRLRC